MAKLQTLFYGSDSLGRDVEVAQSINGLWFCRRKEWNGYANAYGKWSPTNTPTHPKKVLNQVECYNSPEYIELSEEESLKRIEWGFTNLRKFEGKLNYRLPA